MPRSTGEQTFKKLSVSIYLSAFYRFARKIEKDMKSATDLQA